MITNSNSEVKENGIFIPTETLAELKKHYEAVEFHCKTNNSESLSKYYKGKIDLLSNIIDLIVEEKKSHQAKKTK